MKATILQEDLIQKASIASRFISSQPQLPILANFLLITGNGKLEIQATNLEIGIKTSVGAKIDKKGKVTVPAKIFTEIVANLPPGKILLEEQNGKLKISSQLYTINIATQSPSNFPDFPNNLEKETFSMSQNTLHDLLNQVVFASALDESRPVLTGVLFEFGEKVTVVATDGFRLSYKEIQANIKGKQNQMLIPATALKEIGRISTKVDDNLRVALLPKEGQVVFEVGDTLLVSKTIEGDFPDYNKVIPNSWKTRFEVGKEEMLQAVRVSTTFAREASGVVKVVVKDGMIIISSESGQYGKEEGKIEAKTEGENLITAFNYRYLLDALGSIKGDTVIFESEGSSNPGVFKDKKDQTYKHLIMPIRIQDSE